MDMLDPIPRVGRLAITGYPRTGKTTLAERLRVEWGVPVYHTDDFKELPWSDSSLKASLWFNRPSPWIIEGVTVPRALRKWIKRHQQASPSEQVPPLPVDKILVLTSPRMTLTSGQQNMGKGVIDIIDQLEPWLEDRVIYL